MIDKDERAYPAQEILNNKLFMEIIYRLEREAIDRGVNAPFESHDARQAAMADVRAVRSFRRNCQAALGNTPATKAAPA